MTTLTILSTSKPAQVVARATARVQATDATYDQIVDAGLKALGETRPSLFGYGIDGLTRPTPPDAETHSGSFTVYADRD